MSAMQVREFRASKGKAATPDIQPKAIVSLDRSADRPQPSTQTPADRSTREPLLLLDLTNRNARAAAARSDV